MPNRFILKIGMIYFDPNLEIRTLYLGQIQISKLRTADRIYVVTVKVIDF